MNVNKNKQTAFASRKRLRVLPASDTRRLQNRQATTELSVGGQLSEAALAGISNTQVRLAMAAFQNGDQEWFSFFSEQPVLTDNGISINFNAYFAVVLGAERFVSIDKTDNDGKAIYGHFKTVLWGTFNMFFKFYQNENGKFSRLDIGLVK